MSSRVWPQNLHETALRLPPESKYDYAQLLFKHLQILEHSILSIIFYLWTGHDHSTNNTLSNRWKKPKQNRVWWVLFLRCCRSTLSEHAPTAATAQSTAAFNFHEISEEKLENLQLQYHERICAYLSSSSIQISPRFHFSSKLKFY